MTGDGLRVVDKKGGMLVDQVIEKVSFCAPDRNHHHGFAYISRDGTSRRWLCHGFMSRQEGGERLSHAVGVAFAVCLENKQAREREGVTGRLRRLNAGLVSLAGRRYASRRLQSSPGVNTCPTHPWNVTTGIER